MSLYETKKVGVDYTEAIGVSRIRKQFKRHPPRKPFIKVTVMVELLELLNVSASSFEEKFRSMKQKDRMALLYKIDKADPVTKKSLQNHFDLLLEFAVKEQPLIRYYGLPW